MRSEHSSATQIAFVLIVSAVTYIGLVVGKSITPLFFSDVGLPAASLVFLVAILILATSREGLLLLLIACLSILPYAVFMGFGLTYSLNSEYGLVKYDSALVSSAILSGLFGFAIYHAGLRRSINGFLLFSLIVFFATTLYKLKFGFFDRQVRFFLNGPIVFGWFMGLGVLLSLLQYLELKEKRYLIILAVFLVAVIWTVSKGPIVAVMLTAAFILFKHYKLAAFKVIIPIIVCIFAVGAMLVDVPGFERIAALQRLVTGGGGEDDYGSVDVRREMIHETLLMIVERPIEGIGLGSWGEYASLDFLYPHNVFLELYAELGVFFASAVLAIYMAYTLFGGWVSLVVVLYFSFCLLFSGDVGYLRFPLVFQISFFISAVLRKWYVEGRG